MLIFISFALALFHSARKHRERREKHALQRRPLRGAPRCSKHVYKQKQGRLDSGTRAEWPRQVPRAGRNVNLLTPTVFSSRPSDFGRFSQLSATLDTGDQSLRLLSCGLGPSIARLAVRISRPWRRCSGCCPSHPSRRCCRPRAHNSCERSRSSYVFSSPSATGLDARPSSTSNSLRADHCSC